MVGHFDWIIVTCGVKLLCRFSPRFVQICPESLIVILNVPVAENVEMPMITLRSQAVGTPGWRRLDDACDSILMVDDVVAHPSNVFTQGLILRYVWLRAFLGTRYFVR
eukprot:CAMPEP_0167827426 /NCGR_PEP_ID=MMETSP0112_2-20121227/10693_1 /TAXON_ID=91324 /ORGANISM="Lotharella globosa, Strain CCCM811" /LENGTH=107 /DNA_ID=CAMNT_0007730199 /DNA_START=634 /DNA_END=960 /DNA_ORIENTATION=+